jgi:hypothetical protein
MGPAARAGRKTSRPKLEGSGSGESGIGSGELGVAGSGESGVTGSVAEAVGVAGSAAAGRGESPCVINGKEAGGSEAAGSVGCGAPVVATGGGGEAIRERHPKRINTAMTRPGLSRFILIPRRHYDPRAQRGDENTAVSPQHAGEIARNQEYNTICLSGNILSGVVRKGRNNGAGSEPWKRQCVASAVRERWVEIAQRGR